MPQNPKLMRFEKLGVEEMPVSDSFVVDIEGFSHLTEREINPNSRIYSSHSRKGLTRGGGEKKINSMAANQSTAAALEASTTAILHGGSMPEKPVVAAASDLATSPKIHHHQISIKKGSLSSPLPESRHSGKRFGQRNSPTAWSIDPRKILMFFATLSSFGTILLIYFTLSMGKLNGNDDGLTTRSLTSPAD